MSWLLVCGFFQNREQEHFSLSNYRINNLYGELQKNDTQISHFCDSLMPSATALAIHRISSAVMQSGGMRTRVF